MIYVYSFALQSLYSKKLFEVDRYSNGGVDVYRHSLWYGGANSQITSTHTRALFSNDKAVFASNSSYFRSINATDHSFSTLLFLWNLHKKSEIIVMRSLGYSIWNILSPLSVALIAYSVLYLAFLNKAISITHQAHEQYADKVFKRPSNAVTLSKSGLWLRQEMEDNNYAIIHTKGLGYGKNLGPSTLYQFDEAGHLLKRYDVASIDITEQSWIFSKPLLTESNDIQTAVPDFAIATKMTVQKIKQTFQSAGSISFLELPSFINLIEKSGLSGTVHRIQFFKLLLTPFLFLSMALLGVFVLFLLYAAIRGHFSLFLVLHQAFSLTFYIKFFTQWVNPRQFQVFPHLRQHA